jgi:hypothetical protein
MTRDPLAVARDPLDPWRVMAAIRWPRSAGRDPLAVAPLPLPLACDPASSDGRSDGRSSTG